jgi:predicted DNA-binding protein (UPF0278 family)
MFLDAIELVGMVIYLNPLCSKYMIENHNISVCMPKVHYELFSFLQSAGRSQGLSESFDLWLIISHPATIQDPCKFFL